jgi:hypothetical protein
MKVPSLDLELKVLLTVVGICVFGVLRMAHVIHPSETDDISLLFLLGVILSALVFRSARYYSVAKAMLYLCSGLMFWSTLGPNKSAFETCFRWVCAVCFGAAFLAHSHWALKEYRKAKRKGTPELQIKE